MIEDRERLAVLAQSEPRPHQILVRTPVCDAGVMCMARGCEQRTVALLKRQLALCADHRYMLESHLNRLGLSVSKHRGSLVELVAEAVKQAVSYRADTAA